MSQFSKALDKQNALIDKHKSKGRNACYMIDVKPSIRKALEYYYSEMIGYVVKDGVIYFDRLKWLFSDDMLPSSSFKKKEW